MSEWRDIESAPKDGSKFWALVGEDAIAVLWHSGFEAFVSDWRRMSFASGYTLDQDDPLVGIDAHGAHYQDHSPTVYEPRLWMPKSEPPKSDAPTR